MSEWHRLDWDAWRMAHPTMSFADQQAFYRQVAAEYPQQQHFNLTEAINAFNVILPATVVELGGWDGALAGELLDRFPIEAWVNHDIVGVPQACADPRYRLNVLSDYIWNTSMLTGDVFVATHTIEHLTAVELGHLVEVIDTRWIYLEAPLLREGETWDGYGGTHILELGWPQVNELIASRGRGHTLAYAQTDISVWRRP